MSLLWPWMKGISFKWSSLHAFSVLFWSSSPFQPKQHSSWLFCRLLIHFSSGGPALHSFFLSFSWRTRKGIQRMTVSLVSRSCHVDDQEESLIILYPPSFFASPTLNTFTFNSLIFIFIEKTTYNNKNMSMERESVLIENLERDHEMQRQSISKRERKMSRINLFDWYREETSVKKEPTSLLLFKTSFLFGLVICSPQLPAIYSCWAVVVIVM